LIPLWNRLLEVYDAYGTNDPDEADKIVGPFDVGDGG